MRVTVAAFEDEELSNWLMSVIEEQSPGFLCLLAEAVMAASPEEYAILRPVLIQLKRRRAAFASAGSRGAKSPFCGSDRFRKVRPILGELK